MTHALDLFKLDGKVALVTGGSRGLGYFAAEALAEAGADVAICARDSGGQLQQAAARLAALGRDCIGIPCDVSIEADVVALASRVKQHYGRCDILVNNAGIGGITPSLQLGADAWSEMMDVNLKGMFLCCREIGRMMIEQGGGSIINLSSENGQVGFKLGMAGYAATKIGAIGLTRSLAVEWGAHGVRVNAILPGNMQEGMMEFLQDREGPLFQAMGTTMLNLIPLNRFGTGDDMKGATLFLASDAGSYVSGAGLVVDGAFTVNAGM